MADKVPSIVETATRLARETLAPRAAWYDRDGVNPVESWRDLHRERLLAIGIPTAYGGEGLDMATYVAVIRALARGCANTAMTLHMHSTVMKFIAALGTEVQKRRYFADVVEHGRLFGSWGSEPAVSLSRTLLMETAIREAGEGWAVDGVKHFCTMALGASQYMVWCALDGESDMGKALVLALVPADADGITTDGKWNTLGMRGTYSSSVTFSGVWIPREAALGRPGSAIQVGVVESFGLGYAAIYVGVAEAALDFAIDYAKKRVVKPENIAVAQDPTVQRHIGGLAVRLDAARRVREDPAARWGSGEAAARGNHAK